MKSLGLFMILLQGHTFYLCYVKFCRKFSITTWPVAFTFSMKYSVDSESHICSNKDSEMANCNHIFAWSVMLTLMLKFLYLKSLMIYVPISKAHSSQAQMSNSGPFEPPLLKFVLLLWWQVSSHISWKTQTWQRTKCGVVCWAAFVTQQTSRVIV